VLAVAAIGASGALAAGVWLVRRTGMVGWAFALLWGAAWVGVPIWVIVHPVVHVDNATGAPVDLWVDGKRIGPIAPHAGWGEPPHVRVALGAHRLGWSTVGAPKPARETDAEIRPYGDLLYVPAASGCYWIAVTAYGSASTHGFAHGPQPLLELQRFDDLDVWLAEPPARVRALPFLQGTVRVAVQRWGSCMELLARGCEADVRRSYVACMRTIDGHSGTGDCWGEALRSCSAGSAAASRP